MQYLIIRSHPFGHWIVGLLRNIGCSGRICDVGKTRQPRKKHLL